MSELSLGSADVPVNYADVAPVEPKFVTAKGTRPIDLATGEPVRAPCEQRVMTNPDGKFVLDLSGAARAALAEKFAAKGHNGAKRR